PSESARTEFYQHDANWSNRMILGDSLQVMASLAEREGLRAQVQCIYIDPPYGIRFNSNFQWSTTSRDVKDGNVDHITREPEQMKYRNVQLERPMEDEPEFTFLDDGSGHYDKLVEPPTDPKWVFKRSDLKSSGYTPTCIFDFDFHGQIVESKGRKSWRTNQDG